jgi:hypothetical protein
MSDPTGLARFITTVGFVQRTAPHTYSGSFDANASGPFLPIGAPTLVTIGGHAPFTATTDEQNRVSRIHIELPPQPNGLQLVMTTTLNGHDEPLTTKAPSKATVREADASTYE